MFIMGVKFGAVSNPRSKNLSMGLPECQHHLGAWAFFHRHHVSEGWTYGFPAPTGIIRINAPSSGLEVPCLSCARLSVSYHLQKVSKVLPVRWSNWWWRSENEEAPYSSVWHTARHFPHFWPASFQLHAKLFVAEKLDSTEELAVCYPALLGSVDQQLMFDWIERLSEIAASWAVHDPPRWLVPTKCERKTHQKRNKSGSPPVFSEPRIWG